MQSDASTAGADQDLRRSVEELERELQNKSQELVEAREQQAATAEILAAISNSSTDPNRVFAEIPASAARYCDAHNVAIFQLTGDHLLLIGSHGLLPNLGPIGQAALPLTRGSLVGRAVNDKKTIHVADVQADTGEYPEGSAIARRLGFRTMVAVPLMRAGEAIGAITIRRAEVRPFTDRQIELLRIFADQAVIAIENTRLFEAEQASKRELQEPLEYQTATSEVLGVISRSPTDVQPVLDNIVQTAERLCEAEYALILRPADDGLYYVAASSNAGPAFVEWMNKNPVRSGDGSNTGLVLATKKTVHWPDVLAEPKATAYERRQQSKARTALGVPLLRAGDVVGVLFLARTEVKPFSEKQVDLVTTFADQAVIAIENTRLFEEVQARTRELTELLRQQVATSEVLSVISRSPTELKPVFDTIASNAARLCEADILGVFRVEQNKLRMTAHFGDAPLARNVGEAFALTRGSLAGRSVLERRTIHIHDLAAESDEEWPEAKKVQRTIGHRTALAIPLMREGTAVGAIFTRRMEVRPFSEQHIALLQTFADQAVIAIENTRLFEAEQVSKRELQESLAYQTATSDVLNVISRSKFDAQPVFNAVVASACRLCNAVFGTVILFDGQLLHLAATHNFHSGAMEQVRARFPRPPDDAMPAGRAIKQRTAIHIPDVLADAEYPHEIALTAGWRAMLSVPMLRDGKPIGAITIAKVEIGKFEDRQIELLNTFAEQAVIAIENTRLFNEIVEKGRELEIASQHKSQFVANMSHELRTPLAAILGYAELMQEGFYEPLGKKSTDALTRIRSNGKHLLGLINTVLDIAKIESGQFSLNLSEYAIENVVETVRSATESLAETKKLALKTDVTKKLPIGLGDEQRLTQVLLNLVGNAIKFTDTGEVHITATATNGQFTVAVTDTGPGIPPEELKRVFEQFHQIDNSNTKAKGGTGLGLAIAKQIVEMHGGRIWVESTLGKGATFQMQLPIRAEAKKAAE